MQTWKTVSKTTKLEYGKFLTVEEHAIQLPDGRVIDDWPWLITPDFVNVLAVTAEGQVLLFRQVKYGLEGESLAPVGGYIEPGEDPLIAARRELLEEMGCEANEWVDLGHYRVDPNRGAGTGYLFLAKNAVRVAARDADDLEEQELFMMGLDELRCALIDGKFQALAWTTNIALALLHLQS